MENKIELKVVNISSSQSQVPAYAMLLQEVDGERRLPIIIGSAEAQSITFKLNNIHPLRPLTHDLFVTTLTCFDISLTEVLIYKAQEGVFHSYLFIKKAEEVVQIDARTSDAVALAIRFNAPIYIYESILAKECVVLKDEETAGEKEADATLDIKSMSMGGLKRELQKAIEKENYEKASIYRDEIARRKQ